MVNVQAHNASHEPVDRLLSRLAGPEPEKNMYLCKTYRDTCCRHLSVCNGQEVHTHPSQFQFQVLKQTKETEKGGSLHKILKAYT